MLCKLFSAAVTGIEAVPVEVEVDISNGLPGFHLVGLANNAVREGTVRIRAAIDNCDLDLGAVRVTVNLAPADLPKYGSAFDLPIAIGSLCAKRLLTIKRPSLLLAGELALDGTVRPIDGVLSIAELARRREHAGLVVSIDNAREAANVGGVPVFGVRSLLEAYKFLAGELEIEPAAGSPSPRQRPSGNADFCDVRGQIIAKRAAEIAAAGGHNLLLIGPPGSGKTMIAQRLTSILPPMTRDEAIQTTKIHSVAGRLSKQKGLIESRPFRSPHHTCSRIGLIGGGPRPHPGEISLAHNGVLFLDELPEFQRDALEALRQPIEEGCVTLVRAQYAATFPARFMLVAAMNPCPCGFRGSSIRVCICGESQAMRYVRRISGPLLDRFDLFAGVEPVGAEQLLEEKHDNESSKTIVDRVMMARARQRFRYKRSAIGCNADLQGKKILHFIPINNESKNILMQKTRSLRLSARAIHRCLRIARTAADLADSDTVETHHFELALTFLRYRLEQM